MTLLEHRKGGLASLCAVFGIALVIPNVSGIETIVPINVVPWRASWSYFGPGLTNPPNGWKTLSDAALATDPSFAAQTKTITAVSAVADTITVAAHGLSTGAYVEVRAGAGGTLPGNVFASTAYWVRPVDSNTLKLFISSAAAQANSPAVDITSAGGGSLLLDVKKVVTPGGNSPFEYGGITGLEDAAPNNGFTSLPENRIAYFFRKTFDLPAAEPLPGNVAYLVLRYKRDDAIAVWINGVEVKRTSNLSGNLGWDIYATGAAVTEPGAGSWNVVTAETPYPLYPTGNVVSVQVHNVNATPASTDIGFGLEIGVAIEPNAYDRRPYIQMVGTDRATIRFNTATKRIGWAKINGDFYDDREEVVSTNQHEFTFTGLQEGTVYNYSVGYVQGGVDIPLYPATNYDPPADAEYTFQTAKSNGTGAPVRAWILGDPGESNATLNSVADRFTAYMGVADPVFGAKRLNYIILTGDNAYDNGTQAQFQNQLFDNDAIGNSKVLAWMRKACTFPTIGNHETSNSGEETNPNPAQMNAYLNIFSLPTGGECGGMASGSEKYYSFDDGDVHFICLDSQCSDRFSTYTSGTDSPMIAWLKNDLQQTNKLWVVAYWHHPPYSKGGHDSDVAPAQVQMRLNATRVLEDYGVDLVLSGHNHYYARSKLIDGYYYTGTTSPSTDISAYTVNAGTGNAGFPAGLSGAYYKAPGAGGTIYAVVGNSARAMDTFPSGFPHVVALPRQTTGYTGTIQTGSYDASTGAWGSAVLEIIENQLDFKFISYQLPSGSPPYAIRDNFTMYRLIPPRNTTAVENGSSNQVSWDPARGANAYVVQRADFADGPWQPLYEGPNLGTGEGGNPGWEAFYYRVAMKTIDGTLGPWAMATISNDPPSNHPGVSASVSYDLGYAVIIVTLSGSWDGTVGLGRSVNNGATYDQIFSGNMEQYSFSGGNSYGGILTSPPPGVTSMKFKMGTQVTDFNFAPTAPSITYTNAYGYGVDMYLSTSGVGAESITILRSDSSGGPYTSVGSIPYPASSFTDTTVEAGHTYYYVAKAYVFGNASANSAQVSVSN